MIEDKSVITFANQQARPFCDHIAKAYFAAQKIVNLCEAKNLVGLIGDASSEHINDGAGSDGRTPITGDDLLNVVAIARWIIDSSEANNKSTVNQVFKVAVNTGE